MNWLSDDAVARLRDAASEPDLTGTPYRFAGPLGRGGMGAVFLVEDSRLGRRVAMKVLDLPDRSGELEARLLREARVLAQIEHPGIVPVHDVGSLADGRVFYCMKYVQGRRLDEWAGSAASLAERLRLFEKICEPVAFAHSRGVLHRDLKPPNVMVGPFGEVLVMDWGVAKIVGGAGVTESVSVRSSSAASATATVGSDLKSETRAADTAHGSVLGTPGFMAPEQARGEVAQLDSRADIYSLGAILKYLALPASGGKIPRRLAAIIGKAMAQEPQSRYPSAQALAYDVAGYLDGLPISAYPEGIFERAVRIASRNRVAVVLVLAYLVMRILLIFWRPR
jgi:eukaryotic-like serine/threonine-protein kinase